MANVPEASGSGPAASPLRPRRHAGSRDPFLIVCRFFGVVTAAAALLCVAANVLSAVYSFRGGADIIGGVFRCYAVVFSVFVAVLETEWAPVIRLWKIFEYLPARGMLQIFVAIMTKAYPPNVEMSELILLQEIATYMLLVCGAVYIIAGILCLGVLKRSRQHKATSQEQAVKDLEELEKRREELESLLTAGRSEMA